MWVILPLQDWLSLSIDIRLPDPSLERINVPANPRNYWHYRMHLTLESLLAQDDFNALVRNLVETSSRR